VSLDKEKQPWLDAIQKYNLTWPHLSDIKFWESEGAKLYAVNAIPATVLIDKTGKIVGRNMKLGDIQNLLNQ
jgi:thioredoxin-related protein